MQSILLALVDSGSGYKKFSPGPIISSLPSRVVCALIWRLSPGALLLALYAGKPPQLLNFAAVDLQPQGPIRLGVSDRSLLSLEF